MINDMMKNPEMMSQMEDMMKEMKGRIQSR